MKASGKSIEKRIIAVIVVSMIVLSCLPVFPPVFATSDWTRPRPSQHVGYEESIGREVSDGAAALALGVEIYDYHQSTQDDRVVLYVSCHANSRVSINYDIGEDEAGYKWFDVSQPIDITSDDTAVQLPLPFPVLFYGVAYNTVWVCDNGFLCLDTASFSPCPNPQSIPNTDEPNMIIAPFWRDLDPTQPGGSVTCGTVNADFTFFVISWNNVISKSNGVPQSFQVLIRNRVGWPSENYHNLILFSYKSITKDTATTVGVESLVGSSGTTYSYNSLDNELTLKCTSPTEGYRLERLTIKLIKQYDPWARLEPEDTRIRGCNMILRNRGDSLGDIFGGAIGIAAGLLLDELGLLWDVVLITPSLARTFSAGLTNVPDFSVQSADENQDEAAYVTALCGNENDYQYGSQPFDSTLTDEMEWIFTDDNAQDHSLTIRAELTYRSLDSTNSYSLSTFVSLNMFVNRAPDTPSAPTGSTSGYTSTLYTYSTFTTDPDNDNVCYNFDWGDSSNTWTAWYESGSVASATHSWTAANTYHVKVAAQDGDGALSNWSSLFNVTIRRPTLSISTGGGGTTSPAPGTYSYNYGTPVAVMAIPASHYSFYRWLLDGTTYVTSNPTTVQMTVDHSLAAYFSPIPQKTLTVYSSTGGTTSPAAGTYSYDQGTQVSATANPGSHYNFDHWSLDGTTYTSNPISFYMTINHHLTPYFAQIPQKTLTINSNTGGTTNPSAGTYTYDQGTSVTVRATVTTGYHFDHWTLDGTTYTSNPITVQMTTNHALTPYFAVNGGGGGCPYVYTWNGQRYVKDNNILPASETGNGTDTEDYYKLEQPLVPVSSNKQTSQYSLQIREFENEQDYIDQIRLLAVDHSQGTRVAVTPEGEILTYTNLASPTSCVDNHGFSRLNEIGSMDGNVDDPATFFQGYEGDWLILNFGRVTGPYAKLILRDDQKCMDVCIKVQVPDSAGEWQTVEVLNPRDFWSMEAVNMTAYLPSRGDFKVRLLWTATHRLDYVGLDTSAPVQTIVSSALPRLATHSALGDVTAKLLCDDEDCVELVNGQQITLAFTLPNKTQGATRDFILYTNGYYYTITP